MSERNIPLELLGLAGLDPFYGNTHAARGAMFATQIGQAPVVSGSEPSRILTGLELRHAEHTFDIKFPKDCTILAVIRKYPTGYGKDAIKHNPLTTVIYEEFYCPYKTIGVVHIPEYLQFHGEFGYPLERSPNVLSRLAEGANFEGGTPIAFSKSSGFENGVHGVGVTANVVFKSSPGCIEDGFIFSREFLEEKMQPTTYTTVTGDAGRRSFFLNLYGDEHNYKPFPDIGEAIRDDGVIFATRSLDENLTPAEMTPRALREFDHTFDIGYIGEPGAIVKDIDVFFDERQNPPFTPMGMETQLKKYYDAIHTYYSEILKLYRRFQGSRRDKLRITPEFNQLIVEALHFLPQKPELKKLTRTYRLDRLDEWHIKIVFETKPILGNASKFAGVRGDKGVATVIKPRAEMERDKNGNIADCVIFGGATDGRSAYGRLYEQYWNATVRDLTQRLRIEAGLDRHETPTNEQLNALTKDFKDYCFKEICELLSIVAPTQLEIMQQHPDKGQFILNTLKDGYFTLYMPVTDEVNPMEAGNKIKNSRFAPLRDKILFKGFNGEWQETEDPMIIGPMELILLEKIGDDWSAVASVKTQQFGLPARLNASDKYSTPGRESAVRSFGESETRSFNSTVGPEPTNEIMDRTNNPDAHVAEIQGILTADIPTNVDVFVDRNVIPYASRSVDLLDHILECRGIKFAYKEPTAKTDYTN